MIQAYSSSEWSRVSLVMAGEVAGRSPGRAISGRWAAWARRASNVASMRAMTDPPASAHSSAIRARRAAAGSGLGRGRWVMRVYITFLS